MCDNPWARRIVAVFLLLVLIRLVVGSAYHAAVANPGVDIKIYHRAAERLNQGLPLYQAEPFNGYVYTPALALALQPLAAQGESTTVKAWALVNCGFLLLAVGLFCWAVRLTFAQVALIALLILVSFRYWPTTTNLWLGQTNLMLLALLGGMLAAQSRRCWWLVGALIAVAAVMKTWMIGLVVYLLIQRQWKAALVCGGVVVACVVGLFSVVGWGEWSEFAAVTFGNSVQADKVSHSWLGAARLHLTDMGPMPAKVASPVYFWAALAVGAVVLGLPMLYLLLRRPAAGDEELHLRLTLVMATMLLAMPLCHREYLVLLLPLFWCLFTLPRSPGRWRIAVFIVTACVYLTFTRGWPDNGFGPEHATGWRSLMVSGHFVFTLLLWLAGVGTLVTLRAGVAVADEPVHTRQQLPRCEMAVEC